MKPNLCIKVADWVEQYGGVQEAADALGVGRVTLWRWANRPDGLLPERWAYKAASLARKPAKARK